MKSKAELKAEAAAKVAAKARTPDFDVDVERGPGDDVPEGLDVGADQDIILLPPDSDVTSGSSGRGATMFGPDVMKGAPYSVVYADPPWPDKERAQGATGSMAPPYTTMSAAEILQFPIRTLVGPDAILVMWATWGHLELALRSIRAWGFEYSGGMPWLKTDEAGRPVYGQGATFMNCSDPILYARKGNTGRLFQEQGLVRVPRKGLIVSPRRAHSVKPDEVAQWIERALPGPYIELFARRPREGWTVWGNEAAGGGDKARG